MSHRFAAPPAEGDAAVSGRAGKRMLAWLRRTLAGSHERRAISANTGWLLFDKLVRAALGVLVGAWVARHLGPVNFGSLAYVLAFVAMFQPFATLGADAIVVRGIAQNPERAPELLGSTLALRLAIGVVCWLLAITLSTVFDGRDGAVTTLVAIVGGVLVFQAADVVDLWFQSQSASRRTVLAKLTAYLLSNGIKVGLVLGDAPLIAFAAVTAVEGAATAGALYIVYRRYRTPLPWSRSRKVFTATLAEAWPLMLSGLAIMVYMRVDQIIIGELLGARELGVYAVALPISQFWQVIPLTIATSLAPRIAKQKLFNEAAYRQTIVLVFRAFFYMGVVAALTTWLVSGWLVERLFGSAYSAAALLLNVHALSNIFCFLGIGHGLWLVNERRFAVRLYGTMLAGATTIALNFALLPRMGVVGACVTAITAQAIAAFFVNAFLDRDSFRLQIAAITFRRAS